MEIRLRKSFKKDFKKLTPRIVEAWLATLSLFRQNPYHHSLRRHKLSGRRYVGLESIDVLPDLRAVFLEESADIFVFYYIRNHNQLYS